MYLTWGEPPAQVAEKLAAVRRPRPTARPQAAFGIRLHVIVRETDDEAWRAADELISTSPTTRSPSAQTLFARMDSVGQQRMADCMAAAATSSRSPQSLGRRRPGARRRRHRAGRRRRRRSPSASANTRRSASIRSSCSGYPHLEEAYRFAELVFPLLALEHREATRCASSRAVRRNHRQRISGRASRRRRLQASSTSLPRARSALRRRRPGPWLVPLAIIAGLGGRLRRRRHAGACAAGAERRRAGRLAAAAVGRADPQHRGQLWRARCRLSDRRRHRLRARPCQRPVAALRQA